MRGFYLLLFLALVVNVSALGQAVGDFRSATTGPWNLAATWETFNGAWIPAGAPPSSASGVITIMDTHTVNVPGASSVTADQIEFENNFGGTTGILIVDAGGTLTINNGTGDDVRLLNDFTTFATLEVHGTIVLNAAATIVDDDYGNLGGIIVPATRDTYKIFSGGIHRHLLPAAAGPVAQIPNADWQNGSTCVVVGAAAPNAFLPTGVTSLVEPTTDFYDFTWSGAGQTALTNLAGNLRIIRNDLLIDNTGAGVGSILQLGLGVGGYTIGIGRDFIIQNNSRIQFGATANPVVINVARNLNISSTSTQTNAISAIATGTITINVTGDFLKSGASTMTLVAGSGTSVMNLTGNFSLTGGTLTKGTGAATVNLLGNNTATFVNTGTMSGAVAYVVQNGKNLNMTTSFLGGAGAFTLQSGATLQVGSPDGLTIAATALGNIRTTGTRTYQASSNIVYNGSIPQNLGNEWANGLLNVAVNLEINNSSTGPTGGVTNNNNNNTTSVVGNLTLTNGAFRIGTSKTLTVRSAFTATGGRIAGTNTSKLYFTNSGTVTGNLTFEPGFENLSTFWNYRTNNILLGSALTVTDSLRFRNGGNLRINGQTLTVDGIAITESGSGGIMSAVNTSNVIFGGSGAINASNTIPFASTNGGSPVSNTFNDVTLNRSSATYTFSGSNSINGTLGLQNGTLTTDVGIIMETGSTFLRANGTIFGGNTPNATTTYNVAYLGTINPTGNELPDFASGKLNNLTVAGNVTVDRALLINGNVAINSGLLDAAAHDVTMAGATFAVNGGSFSIGSSNTFTFSRAGATTLSGSTINNSTFGIWTINSGATVNAPAANLNITGLWTNNGTFNPGTGTITFSGATQNINANGQPFFNVSTSGGAKTLTGALDVNGTLTIGSILNASANTINIAGTWTNNGTFNRGTGTVIFDGTAQTINSGNPVVQAFNNLTLANSGVKTLGSGLDVNGALTINSGVSLDVSASDFDINLAGAWNNNGTFLPQQGVVFMDGSIIQFIGGTTNTQFHDITVTNPSTVTMSTDQSLINALTLQAGTFNPNGHFTLLSSASGDAYIAELTGGAAISATNMTVQRYLPNGNSSQSYRYLSSPVTNGTVSGWKDNFPITGTFNDPSTVAQWPAFPGMVQAAPSFYRYNEARTPTTTLEDRYESYPLNGTASTAATLTNGRGYAAFVRQSAPIVVDLTGIAAFGTRTVNVTNTAAGVNDGWNLIGNPYASPIFWDNVTRPAGVGAQIAFKDNTNNVGLGGGQYAYFTQGAPGNGIPATYDGTIAQGQAFWIRTTSNATISFQEDDKIATSTPPFMRDADKDMLRIHVAGNSRQDELLILFRDGANDIAENDFDAYKLKNDFINFSSKSSDGKEMAINAFSGLTCSRQIDLVLNTVTPGEYAFTFSQLESFSEGVDIRLLDSFTGATFKATKEASIYNFQVTANTSTFGAGRFKVFIGYSDVNLALNVQAQDICTGTDASIVIQTPETGVVYYATLNGTTVSDQVVGTGSSDVTLSIPKANLTGAENVLVLMARRASCGEMPLTESATIRIKEIPTVSSTTPGLNCGEGTVTLTAAGAPSDGGYKWYSAEDATDAIEGQITSTFITPSLTKTKTFFVSAVNSLGCESSRVAVIANIEYLDAATIAAQGELLVSNFETGNQWYLDGTAISGATGKTIKPTRSGLYKLVVTSGNCKTEVQTDYIVTGDLNEDLKGYVLYPNPTPGLIYVEVATAEEVGVTIQSELGTVVGRGNLKQSGNSRKGQFDISGQARGIYLVVIKHGDHTVVRKIAKN